MMTSKRTMKTFSLQHHVPAQWNAPKNVHALTTTRRGGFSCAPFDSLNLGDHVGDDPSVVEKNRQALLSSLGVDSAQWLEQVHGTACIPALGDVTIPQADACWTDQRGLACVVMTADCLPVFFCNNQGDRVAVAHAGWRGLLDGVLESALKSFAASDKVMAWLGPAIGPSAFEVGVEVKQQFVDVHSRMDSGLADPTATAFTPVLNKNDKFLADIYQLARLRLEMAGVVTMGDGKRCTYTENEDFYSFRREGQTGRMASLIWLD